MSFLLWGSIRVILDALTVDSEMSKVIVPVSFVCAGGPSTAYPICITSTKTIL